MDASPKIDWAVLRSGVLTGILATGLFFWKMPHSRYETAWYDFFDGMQRELPLVGGFLSATLLGVRKRRSMSSGVYAALIGATLLVCFIFGYPELARSRGLPHVYKGYTEEELLAGMVILSPFTVGAVLVSVGLTTWLRNAVHHFFFERNRCDVGSQH